MMGVELRLVAEYKKLAEFGEYTELQMRLFSVKTKIDLWKASSGRDAEMHDLAVLPPQTE
jgi:hypothetical protein